MLSSSLANFLVKNGVALCVGVPDSVLEPFLAYVRQEVPALESVVCANEGGAISYAIGRHLSDKTIPLVYLQNSGLGNAVNPLVSLANQSIYSIPMVLLIGWRGEIDVNGRQVVDEPQHCVMGGITQPLLDLLGVPYSIISAGTEPDIDELQSLLKLSKDESRPVCLLIGKNALELDRVQGSKTEDSLRRSNDRSLLTREEILLEVLKLADPSTKFLATTGYTGRELDDLSENFNFTSQPFLSVGGMGHVSAIAAGYSTTNSSQPVVCLDGDGSMFMHLGNLVSLAQSGKVLHVVINNGIHESVGGSPIVNSELDLSAIAKTIGYRVVARIADRLELCSFVKDFFESDMNHPVFLEVLCRAGVRKNLKRPDRDFVMRKQSFMEF